MNSRRSFFKSLLTTATAITMASAVEVFGVVDQVSEWKRKYSSFAEEIADCWEDRDQNSYVKGEFYMARVTIHPPPGSISPSYKLYDKKFKSDFIIQ